jgi:predicted nucleic acid-binding protein
LAHAFIVGELALGHLRQRDILLRFWKRLPAATVAMESEVLRLINERRLFGRGIGYVDAHLLAALQLSPGARLWTRDMRLSDAARELSVPLFGLH